MIAALLIAEKMGMKIDGEKVKLDFVEMKERDL
jgi:hypothetical protein